MVVVMVGRGSLSAPLAKLLLSLCQRCQCHWDWWGLRMLPVAHVAQAENQTDPGQVLRQQGWMQAGTCSMPWQAAELVLVELLLPSNVPQK